MSSLTVQTEVYLQMDNFLIPSIENMLDEKEVINYDVNESSHRAKRVKDFHLEKHSKMKWQGNRPDLNRIENLWLKFKKEN